MVHLFVFFPQTSFLLPAWTHTFSQSVHSDVDTARSVQGMILWVRTVAYCCEVAMGIQMSNGKACNGHHMQHCGRGEKT